eukprot:COSAG04_NODE_11361_length_714_cov_0.754472_2_plen_55_part_00
MMMTTTMTTAKVKTASNKAEGATGRAKGMVAAADEAEARAKVALAGGNEETASL